MGLTAKFCFEFFSKVHHTPDAQSTQTLRSRRQTRHSTSPDARAATEGRKPLEITTRCVPLRQKHRHAGHRMPAHPATGSERSVLQAGVPTSLPQHGRRRGGRAERSPAVSGKGLKAGRAVGSNVGKGLLTHLWHQAASERVRIVPSAVSPEMQIGKNTYDNWPTATPQSSGKANTQPGRPCASSHVSA
jgi:hypothetical protein